MVRASLEFVDLEQTQKRLPLIAVFAVNGNKCLVLTPYLFQINSKVQLSLAVGVKIGGPGEIRTHDLFLAI